MTLKKLLEILSMIHYTWPEIKLHGSRVTVSNGGEFALDFNTQPSRMLHAYLIRKRFILWDGLYIYRP